MQKKIKTYIFFICIFFASCNQKTAEVEEAKTVKKFSDTVKIKQPDIKPETKAEPDNLGDFSKLLPVEVVNPKGKTVYEKYGIEFTGNCYDCDLAVMSIDKKYFDIVNVCDKADFYRNEKLSYEVTPTELKIKTEKNEFIFTKIDAAPVYELKILGDKISLKKKRLSKFYTPEKELKKFKQHDCGEFEG